MADQYINPTGLQAIKEWAVSKFTNKIEKIKVNGTEQTITNKEVDISVPTVDTNRESGQVTEVHMKAINKEGLRLENSDLDYMYFWFNEASGAVSRSGQLVTKHYVDGEFRTEAQVQQAIDDAMADITNWDYSEPMLTLPATGEKGIIYLVAKGDVLEPPYDEWYWIVPKTGDPYFEKFGDTTIDLSTYWTMTDGKANSLVAMTVSEINAILNA